MLMGPVIKQNTWGRTAANGVNRRVSYGVTTHLVVIAQKERTLVGFNTVITEIQQVKCQLIKLL